jgi:hypothetical protein
MVFQLFYDISFISMGVQNIEISQRNKQGYQTHQYQYKFFTS